MRTSTSGTLAGKSVLTLIAAVAGLGACGTGASSGAIGTGGVSGAGGTSAATSGSGASGSGAGTLSGTANGSSGAGAAGAAGTSGASPGGASGGGSGNTAGSLSGSASAWGDAGAPDSGSPSVDASSSSGSGAEAGSNARDAAACTPASPPSAQDAVLVDMSAPQGSPSYSASGFIYGIAQDGSEPPNTTLSDIKIQGLRVGGAQVGCPNGGYVNGQYAARWNVVKAYYAKAKAIGARVLLLVHDLWGADGACNVPHYPGDGGDWTLYTSFISQVISDVQANGMTGSDVRWELWNEPDLSIFWKGTQAQWLAMWLRGYQQIRAALPDAVFEGPSVATGPGGSWASAFLDYVKTNAVVPDYVSWHEEGGGADPVADTNTMSSQLSQRGLTVSGLDANEYGTSAEQNPGHSAWYLARFERAGIEGLRGNWGEGPGLYEGMGALVTSAWQPDSQWWIYKRYADQTGLRSHVTAGTHTDAVAYQDASVAKAIVVVGNNGGVTGSVNLTFQNVPAWLQTGGSTKVLVETMPTGNAALSAPSVVSSAAAPVTCNAMTVKINWTTATDGYVVTLTPS